MGRLHAASRRDGTAGVRRAMTPRYKHDDDEPYTTGRASARDVFGIDPTSYIEMLDVKHCFKGLLKLRTMAGRLLGLE